MSLPKEKKQARFMMHLNVIIGALCFIVFVMSQEPIPNMSASEVRAYFAATKRIFIDIKRKNIDNVTMEILSMGMSGDFEDAIRAGATMVRVGSSIFGARYYPEKQN